MGFKADMFARKESVPPFFYYFDQLTRNDGPVCYVHALGLAAAGLSRSVF